MLHTQKYIRFSIQRVSQINFIDYSANAVTPTTKSIRFVGCSLNIYHDHQILVKAPIARFQNIRFEVYTKCGIFLTSLILRF